MTYQSTILLERVSNPNIFKFGPQRLEMLAQYAKKLECFNWDIPVITVTGTNGKGSTVAALKAIYQTAGFRAGVYTSPHLLSYHERISVNNEFIPENEFVAAIRAVDEVIDEKDPISFFERLTLVALYYFKHQALDVLILEVGLGGRLDAVNIIDANLVIVTTVDFDHEDYLGHTIDEIAFEKAGLFRPGQTAIFADDNCPRSMKIHADKLGTKLLYYGTDYDYQENNNHDYMIRFDKHEIVLSGKPKVRIQAFIAAMYASFILSDKMMVTDKDWQLALNKTFLPGRIQFIPGEISVVLDVSHNPQGVRHLTQEIQKIATGVQIHAVFSMMKDKNTLACVQEFNKLSPIWYNTVLCGERAHTKATIESMFEDCSLDYQYFPNPKQAFLAARQAAAPNDVIVVFGSFLMVEPIMRLLMEEGYNVFTAH
jgi:dihydrofolate synthase / folylpolyglutamate synthase